jgi:hypothetical protein
MSGFIRRYAQDPGITEITAIEGVVIIDNAPSVPILGAGSGVVCVLGEFEDGPFESPLEVMSETDLYQQFGSFGFTVGGVQSCNPCARKRLADGTVVPEYWNGNGYIALINKKFSRLVVCRADTSVGEVTLTRRASVSGNSNLTWNIPNGQTLYTSIGVPGSEVADHVTFASAVGKITSAAGDYDGSPAISGGEIVTITVDSGRPNQIGPIDVVFDVHDADTRAAAMARINAALSYTCATAGATDVMVLSGRVAGTGGSISVDAIDSTLATITGLSVTSGTGSTSDCVDASEYTLAEIKAIVEGGISNVFVDRDLDGNIRLVDTASGSTQHIAVTVPTSASDLGFTAGVYGTVVTGTGTLPTGIICEDSSGNQWVTMQSIPVVAGTESYTVKVRPATDDGTSSVKSAHGINVLPYAVPLGSWTVDNGSQVAAALSEAAIDAAYADAITSTIDINSVAREINIICSARQSRAVRLALKANEIIASSNGCRGRVATVSPPLKTTRLNARTDSIVGSVGTAHRGVIYAYPGWNIFVPKIAARGLAGGDGFTADGYIDVHADTFLASLMSQLPPEENPGQETSFLYGVNAIEAGNTDVKGMGLNDYEAFKAAGIAAGRIVGGVAGIQSGVTSSVVAGETEISLRRMSYYVQDSLAEGLLPYSKKLPTIARKAGAFGMVKDFMKGLLGGPESSAQRIDSYSIDAKKANTPTSVAAGIFRMKVRGKTLRSMDDIVLDCEVGPNVVTVAEGV